MAGQQRTPNGLAYYHARRADLGLKRDPSVRELQTFAIEACIKDADTVKGQYGAVGWEACMSLTYLRALLHDVYGASDKTEFRTVETLPSKVGSIEVSWALGAMFNELRAMETAGAVGETEAHLDGRRMDGEVDLPPVEEGELPFLSSAACLLPAAAAAAA
jgi:hypothetical protein